MIIVSKIVTIEFDQHIHETLVLEIQLFEMCGHWDCGIFMVINLVMFRCTNTTIMLEICYVYV